MNTSSAPTTDITVAALAAPNVSPPTISITEQIAQLRVALQVAEERQEQAKVEIEASQKAKIQHLPAMFGMDSLQEVFHMLRHAISVPTVHHKSGRLSKGKLDKIRVALTRGMTLSKTAKTFGVSEATVCNYKARWGLVHPRKTPQGIPPFGFNAAMKRGTYMNSPAMTRTQKYGNLPPGYREGIVQALMEGRQSVAQIAKVFQTSRPTVYAVKHRLAANEKMLLGAPTRKNGDLVTVAA